MHSRPDHFVGGSRLTSWPSDTNSLGAQRTGLHYRSWCSQCTTPGGHQNTFGTHLWAEDAEDAEEAEDAEGAEDAEDAEEAEDADDAEDALRR